MTHMLLMMAMAMEMAMAMAMVMMGMTVMMAMAMAMAMAMMKLTMILRPLCRLGTGMTMHPGAILVDHPGDGEQTPDDWRVIASPLLPLLLSHSSRTVCQSL